MPRPGAHDDLHALAARWWDEVLAARPHQATALGDHRFDDRVEDLSAEGEAAWRAVAAGVLAEAEALDAEGLDDRDRVTHALLVDAARTAVDTVDSAALELASDGFTSHPTSLLRGAAQRRAPDAGSAEAQLRRLGRLPGSLAGAVSRWREGEAAGRVPARAALARSRAMLRGYLATPLDDDPFVHLGLPDGWDGADDWRARASEVVRDAVRPAYGAVLGALDGLHEVARDDDRPGLCHVPGGEALYASLARRATTTDLTPQEIHDLGMAELTEVLPAQWREVGAAAVGIEDQQALFAHLRADPSMRYRDAAEILALAEAAIERALAVAPSAFESMPDAPVDVQPVPAALAPGLPPAYYQAPPADGSRPGTYFANTHEPTRRNRFEAEVIAFHEAVPGHHLERAQAAELTDVPTFQQRGAYMAYSEGWGLYTERLADELGLYSSEVMRLGMLSADAWRSVRLVVDTGIHALGWSRERALDLMVDHCPIDRDEAAVEIDRYIGMPGQALSYKVGQREVLRLRARAQAALGPAFDLPGFHRTVLEHGAVPLPILGDLVDAWVARTAG